MTTGLIAIGSALAGAMPGLVSGLLSRKAEDKKQLRELVMQTTAANWRFVAENSKSVLPFEHYMIHASMMCELAFSDDEITEQRTKDHIAKVDLIMRTLASHAISVSTKKTAA